MQQLIENVIDRSPHYLKKIYVNAMIALKWILKQLGLLSYLNRHAKHNRLVHYFRSLLAIHQLEDMIFLDVPWWTYGAIDATAQFLESLAGQATVFEYGSGASTLWLAKRCAKVVSIEHDSQWYAALQNKISLFPHIKLMLKAPMLTVSPQYYSDKLKGMDFSLYVKAIDESTELYDLVIIDGRCRKACLQYALKHLKPQGRILFDNSNRQRYRLQSISMPKTRYRGWVPGSPFKSETTLLSLCTLTSDPTPENVSP